MLQSFRSHLANLLTRAADSLASVTVKVDDSPGWTSHQARPNDRNQAEMLRDQWVWISIADAAPLEEGEVYLHQMLHLRVVSAEGEPLGQVTEIIETGANYVYVVRGARGEILVPDTPEVVLDVDAEARQMTVRLIDGLV